MKNFIYLPLVCLLIVSCNRSNDPLGFDKESTSLAVETDEAAPPGTERTSPETTEPVSESRKKLIKEGRLSILTENLEKSKKDVDQLLSRYNGYYDRENFSDYGNALVYNLEVRIPVDKFENFVNGIEQGFNKITDKDISTVDVTSQYIDLESRLESKRASLQRFREILRTAKSVKEILDVEDHIRQIEEEIESTMRVLKNLQSRTSYSTLNITLRKEQIVKGNDDGNSFGFKLKNAFVKGWHGLVNFFLVLIRIWPFLIFSGILLLVFRKWRIRKK